MIWTLVRKELLTNLLTNLLTLRLIVALAFTVVLCLLTTLMGSLEFSVSVDAYQQALDERLEALNEATIYPRVEPHVLVPPQPVQILARGLAGGNGRRFEVFVDEYQEGSGESVGSGEYDDLMQTLVRIDFSTVVAILLSFLAVVIGFDCISGEREQGTLRLLLSNPVPRAHIIAAKLVGGMLSLWVPLLLAYVVALSILLGNGDVQFSGDDWLRLGLMLALSCLVLGLVFAFSAMVSSITHNSATSLTVCLFVWLIAGVGYMNCLPGLTRYGVPYPPFWEYLTKMREVRQTQAGEMEEWEARNPPPGAAYMKSYSAGPLTRYSHPRGNAWREQRARFRFDQMLEYADEDFKYRTANQMPLAQQEFLVDKWAVLSPLTNYRSLMKYLARSSLDDLFFFSHFGQRYRVTYVDYLRTKMSSASWRRWFTDDPVDQEPLVPDPESVTADMLADGSDFMSSRAEWLERQQELAARDPARTLDLTDLPKYGDGWKRTLGQSLTLMMPGLIVLLLSFSLCVTITVLRFVRYRFA
ncbi:MAG TPA: ABC transporter permease subunit [Candidatus Latescibacteria bacterium]|jgi:hypothetical protein|nr:hypothetical protein [Gemmatimonadaceae bacterium]MDP6017843.1 ABC transporter permease subunit [Candidatus Latescibacterota bacterium]HJP32500.1 ABC transporter permease subunit [Candidatus Latescibacterota bacterium]